MGTNFYIKGHCGNDNPKYHIGKRSANVLYCWNCNKILCVDDNSFLKKCPTCGKEQTKEPLSKNAIGRELGFNNNSQKQKGVTTCCSFTWARPIGKIKHIVDEYEVEYTLEEFKVILSECSVQYEHFNSCFS
jgi:hypothetical protein